MPHSRLRGTDRRQPCNARNYQPDEATEHCPLCRDEFTLLTRRHHCRWCGGLACAKCTESRRRLRENSSKKQRVCSMCVAAAAAFEAELRSAPSSGAQTPQKSETHSAPSTRTSTPRSDNHPTPNSRRKPLTALQPRKGTEDLCSKSPLVVVQPALATVEAVPEKEDDRPVGESKEAEKEQQQAPPTPKQSLSIIPEEEHKAKKCASHECDACNLAREVRAGIMKDREVFAVSCALALFLLVLGKLWVIAIWWAWGWLSLRHIQEQSTIHTLGTALRKGAVGPRWSERFLHGSVCLGLLVMASVIANVEDLKRVGPLASVVLLTPLLPLAWYAGWLSTVVIATSAAFGAGGAHLRRELLVA